MAVSYAFVECHARAWRIGPKVASLPVKCPALSQNRTVLPHSATAEVWICQPRGSLKPEEPAFFHRERVAMNQDTEQQSTSGIDRTAVRRVKIEEAQSDFAFWQTQSYEQRLAALEQIRQEYIVWKYGTDPGFQRVLSVVKRSSFGFSSISTRKEKARSGFLYSRCSRSARSCNRTVARLFFLRFSRIV